MVKQCRKKNVSLIVVNHIFRSFPPFYFGIRRRIRFIMCWRRSMVSGQICFLFMPRWLSVCVCVYSDSLLHVFRNLWDLCMPLELIQSIWFYSMREGGRGFSIVIDECVEYLRENSYPVQVECCEETQHFNNSLMMMINMAKEENVENFVQMTRIIFYHEVWLKLRKIFNSSFFFILIIVCVLINFIRRNYYG